MRSSSPTLGAFAAGMIDSMAVIIHLIARNISLNSNYTPGVNAYCTVLTLPNEIKSSKQIQASVPSLSHIETKNRIFTILYIKTARKLLYTTQSK